MFKAQVRRITIEADAISIELTGPDSAADNLSNLSRQIVGLPWTKKPFRATKGAINGPTIASDTPLAGQVVLAAIGRARHWVDELMSGGTIAEIAKREGKGERQIRLLTPLAFVSPATVRGTIDGSISATSVTELARQVPQVWQ
jgi:site-specific DNA recombinase